MYGVRDDSISLPGVGQDSMQDDITEAYKRLLDPEHVTSARVAVAPIQQPQIPFVKDKTYRTYNRKTRSFNDCPKIGVGIPAVLPTQYNAPSIPKPRSVNQSTTNASSEQLYLLHETRGGAGGHGTPFRLPRVRDGLAPGESEEDLYRLWSRHGYDYYNTRPSELSIMSPHSARRPTYNYPRLAQAMISPVQPPHPRLYAGAVNDAAIHKHIYEKNREHYPFCEAESGPTTTPVPGVRMFAPPKSAQSIHWTLSGSKNLHYDKKGKSKVQGPYSREFTVTCATPNSWLKMKLGRSKTTIV